MPAAEVVKYIGREAVQGGRALIYSTAELLDIHEGLVEKLEHEGADAREIRRNPEVIRGEKILKLLTPICKLLCSEEANAIAYKAMGVFGGSGFTEEYDIARIYRDVRATSIYEGTSDLQVVAAIGGIVEGMRATTLDARLHFLKIRKVC